MRRPSALAISLLLLLASPARAVMPDEQLPDAKLEGRARAISSQLRCVVCQNQTIDDSDADLARDLRLIIRERLVAGDSDRQAIDFVERRYGSFVLLRPPLDGQTLFLWLGPSMVLGAGAIGVAFYLRRRSAETSPDADFSEAEAP